MKYILNITDEQLLNRIKQNDEVALELLFRRYFKNLCFFANRLLMEHQLAEEVVSDIFLNIWLKRGQIKINSSFKAYLYKAVKNQSINYLQKRKINIESLEVVDKEGLVSSLSPEHFLRYNQLDEEIKSLIKELPEKRRLIFRMNRIDGLSYSEIAEILEISINTVQNQMVNAVKFLLKKYQRISKLFSLL